MTDEQENEQQIASKVIKRPIEVEMKKSYIDYAMSVIVGRALPDVSDGLKPVHRRILYAMNEMGLVRGKSHKKSARVVGEVLGKYHPHGDVANYDTLVRMAQDFSMRYPLVDGQGNFGSVDGDRAAAMRYTECRLAPIAWEMLEDVDEETVDFVDNFDGSLKEPVVLPSKLPNLLINGSSGIAVGMATNIPPHNLGEIVDAIVLMIDSQIEGRDPDLKEIMDLVKGPDFPTGGLIYGAAGIVEAYSSGRGKIRVRARTTIERDEDTGRATLIVSEIPYMVNKSKLMEEIAELVKSKRIEGISDLRDESDRDGMRIVIELKRDALEDVVLNQLFAHSQLQTTFGINNLALVDTQPRVLSLKEMLEYHIEHRFDVVKRRLQHRLREAERKAHILAGLMIALDHLDDVIKTIRKSKTRDEAKTSLMKMYLLTEVQTKAILEMQLQRLTGMEMQAVKDDFERITNLVEEYKAILRDEKRIFGIIKQEAQALKEKYGDSRRTDIEAQGADLDYEDLIPVEDVLVTTSRTGYIKRISLDTYASQKRGGVGLVGMGTKEEDHVVDMFVTSSHDYVMFFTNRGKGYWLKAYRIPVGGRHAKGKPIVNLIDRLQEGEYVMDKIPISIFDEERYLVFATKKGIIKKTRLMAYSHVRQPGIIAMRLDDGDELVGVAITDGTKEVVLATKLGYAGRFNEADVRSTGRATYGVKGVTLRKDDEVVSMAIVDPTDHLLTITERGYGKRSLVSDYRKTRRGGKGVITIKTGDRNGNVLSVLSVADDDELMFTSVKGMMIRMPVHGIRLQSRATLGVRFMRLKGRDLVTAVARLVGVADEERLTESGMTITKAPTENGDLVDDNDTGDGIGDDEGIDGGSDEDGPGDE
ncbi:MAG: DNA gyrase subunit A [Candidatus Thermoplasmatota archaeon]|nr:DNA gyrase subunit A [Candidatus Thermoplasmatota archaeon]